MAKKKPLKLAIDLVPETCWYKSLRREMPRRAWDKLRAQVLEEQGGKCHVCGGTDRLSCHEIWDYDEKAAVQRLRGFRVVCGMCHHAVHFGMAQILADQGRLDLEHVIRHSLKVNGVTRKTFEAHVDEAFEVWRRRSRLKWRTELGEWATLVPAGTKA